MCCRPQPEFPDFPDFLSFLCQNKSGQSRGENSESWPDLVRNRTKQIFCREICARFVLTLKACSPGPNYQILLQHILFFASWSDLKKSSLPFFTENFFSTRKLTSTETDILSHMRGARFVLTLKVRSSGPNNQILLQHILFFASGSDLKKSSLPFFTENFFSTRKLTSTETDILSNFLKRVSRAGWDWGFEKLTDSTQRLSILTCQFCSCSDSLTSHLLCPLSYVEPARIWVLRMLSEPQSELKTLTEYSVAELQNCNLHPQDLQGWDLYSQVRNAHGSSIGNSATVGTVSTVRVRFWELWAWPRYDPPCSSQ